MTAATVAVFEGQLALRGTHCPLFDRNHVHWSEGGALGGYNQLCSTYAT